MRDLSTRNARKRIERTRTIQWVKIARGRALGYRRPATAPGTWYARVYVNDSEGSPYRVAAIGTADDRSKADGRNVFSYSQAVEQASRWNPDQGIESGQLTVADAVCRYLDWMESHRKSAYEVRKSLEAHVLSELGSVPMKNLTVDRLRRWHRSIAESPARLRGESRRKLKTDEDRRRRKSTANRVLAMLKAALNRAVDDGLADAGAWLKVKPFRGVEAARTRYLEAGELRALLNACDRNFRDLVAAAVHTGARYSELATLEVGDFRPEAHAVHFRKTKTSSPRHVYLSEEGERFFERLAAGRVPEDRLLLRADGESWGKSHQQRPMTDACQVAKIKPPLRFHELRHTYASLYLMNGGGLPDLAKQLGHSTTRMVEKHYGHLANAWRAERARRFAPRLESGRRSSSTVVSIRRGDTS